MSFNYRSLLASINNLDGFRCYFRHKFFLPRGETPVLRGSLVFARTTPYKAHKAFGFVVP